MKPEVSHDLQQRSGLAKRRAKACRFVWHVRIGENPCFKYAACLGDWFHYSIDYRIGTRYMGEFIEDSFKREAMGNRFCATC